MITFSRLLRAPQRSPGASGRARGGRIAAALVCALVSGSAIAASAPAAVTLQTLHGPGFHTAKPHGWHTRVSRQPVKGAGVVNTDYRLSSTGAGLNRWGIPPAGAFGITIDALPVAGLAHGVPGAGRVPPSTLLDDIVDVPSSAQLVLVQSKRMPARLDGVPASTISYVYYYAGRVSYQHDIVARHRGTVVFLELDTDFDMRTAGDAALATVVRGWHWH